jgi:hypothetical protein
MSQVHYAVRPVGGRTHTRRCSRTRRVKVGSNCKTFFYILKLHSKGRTILAFRSLFRTEKLQLTSCACRITKGKFHCRDKCSPINRCWISGFYSFFIVRDSIRIREKVTRSSASRYQLYLLLVSVWKVVFYLQEEHKWRENKLIKQHLYRRWLSSGL